MWILIPSYSFHWLVSFSFFHSASCFSLPQLLPVYFVTIVSQRSFDRRYKYTCTRAFFFKMHFQCTIFYYTNPLLFFLIFLLFYLLPWTSFFSVERQGNLKFALLMSVEHEYDDEVGRARGGGRRLGFAGCYFYFPFSLLSLCRVKKGVEWGWLLFWSSFPISFELIILYLFIIFFFLPAKNSTKQRGVEAFGRREASLYFANRHFVLGGGREERQPAGHRAKHVRRSNRAW